MRFGKVGGKKGAGSWVLAVGFSAEVLWSEGNFLGKSEGQDNAAIFQQLHCPDLFQFVLWSEWDFSEAV